MSRALPTVGPVERALYLRSLPLFHSLPPAELTACALLLDEVMVRRQTTLYGPREGVPAVYLVVEGMIHDERGGRVVCVHDSPDIAGLVEFFAADRSIPRGVAATNVLALAIESGALLDLLEDHFPIYLQARTLIGAQLAQLQRELNTYCLTEPSGALAEMRHARAAVDLDPAERLLLLQRLPEFCGVGLGVLAALIHEEHDICVPAGEVLWEAGSDAEFFLVLARGNVTCVPEGSQHPFHVGPGSAVGAEAVFGGTARAYSAVAESEVLALRIHAQLLLDLAEDNFDLALCCAAHMAREILRLQAIAAGQGAQ